MKKILFISPYAFNKINGGSVLFNKLFKEIKLGQLDWFICSDRLHNSNFDFNFSNIYQNYNILFDNSYINSLARKYYWIGSFFYYFKYKHFAKFIHRKLFNKIIQNDIDFLWIYLSHSSISSSAEVIRGIKLKYHLSIQDDVHTHLPFFESKDLEEDYKYLIENASSIDFISDNMRRYYEKVYNVKAKATTFLIADKVEVALPIINENIQKIGFAGNVWCADNFICILENIKKYNNEFETKIKFVVYTDEGAHSFFNSYKDIVDLNGMIPYENLISELQKCDLLYLPMTFTTDGFITNQTSFPSKILTYLNAGIPLLNHSPVESVSHEFIMSMQIGYSITTCEINQFYFEFNKLMNVNHYKLRNVYSKYASKALRSFDSVEMIDKLNKLILNSLE
jgi:hypothetical protein